MSTLSELGDYLATALGLTQGSATDADGNLFLGTMPDAPSFCLVIYQYPGGESEYIQNQFTPNAEKAQIQVAARADDYDAADRLCARAWNALAPIRNAVISGTKYRSIMAQGRGIIRVDSNDRPVVAFNATVEKEVSLVA
jgi:hypothetical protein